MCHAVKLSFGGFLLCFRGQVGYRAGGKRQKHAPPLAGPLVMLPIRRVAPIRLIHLTLVAGCVLTQGVDRPVQAENTALVAQSDLSFDPYSVFVAGQKAYARCGPASDYYRTDPLRQGQELEVYAQTDDGWLGIRPPEESFCWVPADTIEMADSEEDGTVVEDRTVAWIGTHLGRARTYRW